MTAQLMKKGLMTLATLGLAVSATGAFAQATTITVYNFNDGATTGGSNAGQPQNNATNTAALLAVDRGAGTLSVSQGFITGNNVVSFAGTTVNADAGDVAGAALALQGGGTTAGAAANNGGFLQLNSSTVGFSNIVVSFAAQATATGFKNDQFQYSTDGTTFTNFGAAFAPQASFFPTATPPGTATVFDLSSIAGLNNNANAAFRLTLDGATSSAGNIRIDNLLVQGTAAPAPEPSTLAAFAMIGAGVLGLVAARRRATA